MSTAQLMIDDRAAWVSLPLVGDAYAARSPTHDFGYGLEMDRENRSATLWLGPWEITADSSPRRAFVPAFVPLMTAALLKALVWPNSRADRNRQGGHSL